MIGSNEDWRRRYEAIAQFLNDRSVQRDDDGDLLIMEDERSPFYIARSHVDDSDAVGYWEVMPTDWKPEDTDESRAAVTDIHDRRRHDRQHEEDPLAFGLHPARAS